MAGAPKQSDHVAAQYVTLHGQQATLSFARSASLGDMQRDLCAAFAKYWPTVEVGLIIDETTLCVDMIDKPLLNMSEGKTNMIGVIFTRATDLRGLDQCFRGRRSSFEEDMREGSE